MSIFALIAVATSALALVTVATGILVLSISRALKPFADRGVSAVSSVPARIHEAKMPSLATLYIV